MRATLTQLPGEVPLKTNFNQTGSKVGKLVWVKLVFGPTDMIFSMLWIDCARIFFSHIYTHNPLLYASASINNLTQSRRRPFIASRLPSIFLKKRLPKFHGFTRVQASSNTVYALRYMPQDKIIYVTLVSHAMPALMLIYAKSFNNQKGLLTITARIMHLSAGQATLHPS